MTQREQIKALQAEVAELREKVNLLEAQAGTVHHHHHYPPPTPPVRPFLRPYVANTYGLAAR